VKPVLVVLRQHEAKDAGAQKNKARRRVRARDQGSVRRERNAGKIEQARKLYARYRTDDVLDRLKNEASDKSGKPQPWE
jgi:hypothetical protein